MWHTDFIWKNIFKKSKSSKAVLLQIKHTTYSKVTHYPTGVEPQQANLSISSCISTRKPAIAVFASWGVHITPSRRNYKHQRMKHLPHKRSCYVKPVLALSRQLWRKLSDEGKRTSCTRQQFFPNTRNKYNNRKLLDGSTSIFWYMADPSIFSGYSNTYQK